MTACTLVDPTAVPTPAAPPAPAASPALDSLAGRKVALLKNAWPSWHRMTDRFERLLTDRVDGVSVEQHLIPNGSAADPGQLESIAASADAAVVGLANCGSCTAWSYHDAVALGATGMPVVLVVTSEFTSLVDALAAARGVQLPCVVIPANPETVDGDTALRLLDHAYEPVVGALLKRRTTIPPLPAAAHGALLEYGSDDAALEACHEQGWTDGLPVVLPTVRRVEAMVADLGAPPSDGPLLALVRRQAAVIDKMSDDAAVSMLPNHSGQLLKTLAELEDRARKRGRRDGPKAVNPVHELRAAHSRFMAKG